MLVASKKKNNLFSPPPPLSRVMSSKLHLNLPFLRHFDAPLRSTLESWIADLSTDDDFKSRDAVDRVHRALIAALDDHQLEKKPQLFDALELIYVSLLGHHCAVVREIAIVDLNILYDGHTLQAHEPLPVTIADADTVPPFEIHLAQSNRSGFDPDVINRRRVVLRMYGSHLDSSSVPTWKEFPFPCPGFYDWVVAEPGSTSPAALEASFSESHRKLRGRFIVQPKKARESVIMEMPVDEVGAVWDEKTGQLRTRGSFDAVARLLNDVKLQGVTTVYMMGALERPMDDPVCSPMAVVDRQCPAAILGGERQFKSVIAEISRLGMTPVVDALDRVSRNRMHRKYKSHTVETLDKRGIPLRHPGTDGQQNQWEDTALLNYRNIATWKLFLSEIHTMASKYGVRGIRLDNAQSFPPIMTPNMEELLRVDTDSEPHYSLDEIFFGSVVKASSEYGFWSSDACVERNYPNPFFVKLCKEMWKKYPDFLVIAEAHFHRESTLLSSGAITHSVRIPQIMASISGNSFRRDGSVVSLPEGKRSSARTLSRLYRNDKVWLPKNPIMINCTCTHLSPYPGVLYGRRAWLAVDMLAFLPDVPMVLYGEERGRAYRTNMATGSGQENAEYDVNFDAILPKSPTKKPTSPADVGLPALSLTNPSGITNLSALRGLGRLPPASPTAGASLTRKPRLKRNNRSFADLRRPSSNKSMVRSVSRDDMKSMAVRSLSIEDLQNLSAREEAKRQEIGPSSGFDLAKIKGHYGHRMLLRQEVESFRRGRMCILSVDPHLKEQVFAFSRFTEEEISIVVANFKDSRDGDQYAKGCHVDVDLRPLWDHLPDCYIKGEGPSTFYKAINLFSESENSKHPFTIEEAVFRKYGVDVAPLSVSVIQLKKATVTNELKAQHFRHCLSRLLSAESNDIKDPRENYLISQIARGAASSVSDFAKALDELRKGLMNDGCDEYTIQRTTQLSVQRASQLLFMVAYENVPAPRDFDPPAAERIVAYLTHLSTAARDAKLLEVTRSLVTQTTKLGPLVFLTAELGRFSTAGGLGVMVDELTKGLANLGLEVYVVSPYYTVNRKNISGYLGDTIKWTRNVKVDLGTHTVDVGVFEGQENGVNLIFLERGDFFPKVYADTGGAVKHLQTVVLMSLGSLEICAQKGLVPSLIVSNDWLPSMAPGYRDYFGDYFKQTSFFHLIHNLGEAAYEGRCYPDPRDGTLSHIHRINDHELVDPWWNKTIINPSRCALIKCDSWGTVSPSYMKELLAGHPLRDLLHVAKSPFAYPNGIRQAEREQKLTECGCESHAEAKDALQKKYFGFQQGDPTIPLFAFVGRITSQKGVHLILNAVDELIAHTGGKIQILIGGPANYSDEYSAACARHMHDLRRRHPWCFWANPDEFFTDGPMTNLGTDFGLMPSLFEPGGIVQQEFFVAGTPVIAYKTGGLKDTVHEWKGEEGEGNGFTFEEYSHGDFVWAVKRALRVFSQPEEYEDMRASAYETTIDVKEVAWAWSTEFHRIRNAMYTKGDAVSALVKETVTEESDLYDESARPVEITWSGGGRNVLMKGSFDNWIQEWDLLPIGLPNGSTSTQNSESQKRSITLRLPRGEYEFKFKVDGEWQISDDCDQKSVGDGFVNNFLRVE